MTFWLIVLIIIIIINATTQPFKGFKEYSIWLAIWAVIEILVMTIGG